jgi:hypothetical protein
MVKYGGIATEQMYRHRGPAQQPPQRNPLLHFPWPPAERLIHTSHISTMYKMMWLDVLAASPVLDFANHDFIGDNDQMLERAAATVTMCVCVCV